jgi:predicted 3-demethylubiquinone-9 3-methyltransferase (glyoxalase superfamily)
MKRIQPCLWFDGQAEQAAAYYVSLFPDSKVKGISHYGKASAAASGQPEGSVMAVWFELDGQPFMALNGGPTFKFSEAVSFVVRCKNQKEVDDWWRKLSQGGEEGPCGWLKDKYGVSWQVVPEMLPEVLEGKDEKKAERVMAAMLRMKKLDVDALERAAKAA